MLYDWLDLPHLVLLSYLSFESEARDGCGASMTAACRQLQMVVEYSDRPKRAATNCKWIVVVGGRRVRRRHGQTTILDWATLLQ